LREEKVDEVKVVQGLHGDAILMKEVFSIFDNGNTDTE
jgi:hypothetical protein